MQARDDEHPPRATAREWTGLAVLTIPCLIYAMDLTVLYLAVPEITEQLRPSASKLLWIVDVYGFMVAGFLITFGTLGDRIGRRKLLLIGAFAFAAASAAAAFSPTPEALIAARAIQGIAGATLAPSTLALITNMFRDDRERTFAIGVWIAAFSSGAAFGPVFGGVILEHFWWGAVFLINVPIMLLLMVLAPALLPEYRAPNAGRIDLLSALQSLTAVLAIMYALKAAAERGPSLALVLIAAAGLAIGALFLRRQKRLADPMVDLNVLKNPQISGALTVNVLGLFTVLGTFLLIAQYFQLVLGMGPLEAGLWTAPSGVVFAIGSMATPRLLRHVGPSTVIVGGLLIAAVGFALLTQVKVDGGFALLFVAMLIFCLGVAPIGTTTTDLVMAAAPPERAGSVSAISETSFEFGGAVGIAVLGSIMTAIYRHDLGAFADPAVSPSVLGAARETLGAALEVAKALPVPAGDALVSAAREAFVDALRATAAVCALASLLAIFVTVSLLSKHPKEPTA